MRREFQAHVRYPEENFPGVWSCENHSVPDLKEEKQAPVVFAIPGKGKKTLKAFKKHLAKQGGKADNILEVVSDMSGAFISGIKSHFSNSSITVDWFHVVQLFSKAVDEVRRKEAKAASMPKAVRRPPLKAAESELTERQLAHRIVIAKTRRNGVKHDIMQDLYNHREERRCQSVLPKISGR